MMSWILFWKPAPVVITLQTKLLTHLDLVFFKRLRFLKIAAIKPKPKPEGLIFNFYFGIYS